MIKLNKTDVDFVFYPTAALFQPNPFAANSGRVLLEVMFPEGEETGWGFEQICKEANSLPMFLREVNVSMVTPNAIAAALVRAVELDYVTAHSWSNDIAAWSAEEARNTAQLQLPWKSTGAGL